MNLSANEVAKRWFSLAKQPVTVGPTERTIWPKVGTPAEFDGDQYTINPIRYCYADQKSASQLMGIVNQAINGWKPALFPHTAADIKLDPGCKGNFLCVCDTEGVAPDALKISDESFKGRKTVYSDSDFAYISKPSGEISRNGLRFGHLDQLNLGATRPEAVMTMMHEFSKSIEQ